MTTKQDYLIHKAAYLLSLEARQRGLKGGTNRYEEISSAIRSEFSCWDISAKGKVIKKMSELKSQNPGFDWERNWTAIQGV